MGFNPRNILVIDFGQLGDVVLSLPALGAVRRRFAGARISVAVGRAAGAVLELAGVADEVLPVDRVGLRDGPKVLSGVPQRLYARRPGRSLDYLSNFRPQAPVEDRKKHAIDRYLDVLKPLGVGEVSRVPRLPVRAEDDRAVDEILRKMKAPVTDAPLVGMFPGAGHASRRWPVERFAELAWMLERNDAVRVVLFAGPEERSLVKSARGAFPASTVVLDRLSVPQLAAAAARLSVFVSNDTGPMHVAAAVGTPVVILMQHHPMSDCYVPPGERHRVVHARAIEEITPEQAYEAARAALNTERAASLFSS